MSEQTILALLLSILLFSLGVYLLIKNFPRKAERPLHMKAVFDVEDNDSFRAIMAIISSYDLMYASYEEDETTSSVILGIQKEDYEPIFRSLKTLPNVEVI